MKYLNIYNGSEVFEVFERYCLSTVKYIKIKSIDPTYVYVCTCNEELNRVYVPSLNRGFSYNEVSFVAQVEAEDLLNIPGLEKRVRCETDDFGNPSCYLNGTLNDWDLKKLEKFHNIIKKPSKKDNKFYR